MTDEKVMLYGADEAAQHNADAQNGKQVGFAIAKTTAKSETLGAEGSGKVVFSESDHKIVVNGVKYGAVDSDGNDVKETYATQAALQAVEETLGQNQANLKLFSKIGDITAESNSDELGIATSGDATVSYEGKTITIGATPYTAGEGLDLENHQFKVKAATDAALGAVKSGGDITVAADGAVTVNQAEEAEHADAADQVKVTDVATETSLNVVLVDAAGNAKDLKDSALLKYVASGDDKSMQYSGAYKADADIATKKNVDDAIAKIEGEALNGMHYKGSTAAIPTTDASVGDFYIMSEDIADSKIQKGDFVIYNSEGGWDVINRNITETSEVKDDDSSLIPTEGAVKAYVDGQIGSLQGDGTYIEVGNKTISHKELEVTETAGDAINLSSTQTSFTVVTGVADDDHGHLSEITTQTVDISGALTAAGDAAAQTVDMNAVTDDKERGILAATGTASAEKQEASFASDITVNAGKGTLTVGSGDSKVVIKNDGTVVASGDITSANVSTGAVTATGDATIGGSITATGDATVGGDLAVSGDAAFGSADSKVEMTLNGVKIDETKVVQSVTCSEAATTTATIADGNLAITGVSAIAADGVASTTNTYNAAVVQQSIFWTVE